MSNLLTGLALALGGGLQGYARGKEMQRQARLEEEEQAARRKREEEQRTIQRLSLARDGIYADADVPDAPAALSQETENEVARLLGMGLGAAGRQAPSGNVDWQASPRFQALIPGFKQDVTRTKEWQDRDTQYRDRERQRILNDLAGKASQGSLESANRGRAMGVNFQLPEPETPRNIDPLSPEGIEARVDFARRTRGFGPATQAELDRPEKMKRQFIETVIAAQSGDLPVHTERGRQELVGRVAMIVNSDDELRRQAERFGITNMDWLAAAARWAAGPGAAIDRSEVTNENLGNRNPMGDDSEIVALANDLRRANPEMTAMEAMRQATAQLQQRGRTAPPLDR